MPGLPLQLFSCRHPFVNSVVDGPWLVVLSEFYNGLSLFAGLVGVPLRLVAARCSLPWEKDCGCRFDQTCHLDATFSDLCSAARLEGYTSMEIGSYFQGVAELLPQLPAKPVEEIVAVLRQAQLKGKRIFMFGNGGSAANASHIVNDILKSTAREGSPRFKMFCLSDNVPTLTAYANDVGYEVVYAEPLAALAEAGDVAFGLSGSGNSPNILCAMQTARRMGLTRIGLTGRDGGQLKDNCDICIVVPTQSMQMIEDAHLVILHAIFLALCE